MPDRDARLSNARGHLAMDLKCFLLGLGGTLDKQG